MDVTTQEISTEKTQRVSVVVPSYNHAVFIERCLKSIIQQSFAPHELLVIDDGSKDDSPKAIESVLKDCPFPCELIARSNKGLCATLNEGFDRTSGDYFAYLGSDDVWLPEFVESRVRLLDARPNAVLGYGHAYLIDEEDQIIDCSSNWETAAYPDGDARELIYHAVAPINSSVFYKRAPLERRKWNEHSHLEDYELYLQLCHDGEFAFDKRVLSAWRMHSYNTSSDWHLMLKECLEAQCRLAKELNFCDSELARIQRITKFSFIEIFIRRGNKRKALSLLKESWRSAPSYKAIARASVLWAIPIRLLNIRKELVRRRSIDRLGRLKV